LKINDTTTLQIQLKIKKEDENNKLENIVAQSENV
jgi:hypothetical protein